MTWAPCQYSRFSYYSMVDITMLEIHSNQELSGTHTRFVSTEKLLCIKENWSVIHLVYLGLGFAVFFFFFLPSEMVPKFSVQHREWWIDKPRPALTRKKWWRPMAFVLGDQFSRANLLPVNHPPLSSPPAPSPSLALFWWISIDWHSAGTRPCMQLWPMGAVSLASLSIPLFFPPLCSRNIH